MNQRYNTSSIQTFYGLSTDTKPSGCSSGSRFVEINTGDKYIYDGSSDVWTKIPTGGSPSPSIDVDTGFSPTSTNPVQNKVITLALTPMSESEYSELQTYDMPLYFIYEDEADSSNNLLSDVQSPADNGGQKSQSSGTEAQRFPDEEYDQKPVENDDDENKEVGIDQKETTDKTVRI